MVIRTSTLRVCGAFVHMGCVYPVPSAAALAGRFLPGAIISTDHNSE
jgi:hypothetical protein